MLHLFIVGKLNNLESVKEILQISFQPSSLRHKKEIRLCRISDVIFNDNTSSTFQLSLTLRVRHVFLF